MVPEEMSKEAIFESDKSQTFTTEHYVFHYPSGSLAEKEIQLIAQTQEASFCKICGVLNVYYPERIHYYFTDSPLDIGRLFWAEGTLCNGVALCGKNRIYAVYNEAIQCIGAHEDTHLISFLFGFPQSDFIVEGLAMFFDEAWWGISNEVWASYFKSKYAAISIRNLLDNHAFAECGCVIGYPIAGAFTGYLIQTYGIERYLKLYTHDGTDLENIVQSIYNMSLTELETSFWNNTCRASFDAFELEELLKKEGF